MKFYQVFLLVNLEEFQLQPFFESIKDYDVLTYSGYPIGEEVHGKNK